MIESAQTALVDFDEKQREHALHVSLKTMIQQFRFQETWNEERIKLFNHLFENEKFLHCLSSSFSCRFSLDSQKRSQVKEWVGLLKNHVEEARIGSKDDKEFVFSFFRDLLFSILKTTFFASTSQTLNCISFRIDPNVIWSFFPNATFPEKPFAIFFIFSPGEFLGFHVRFQDLARGGLRTVYIPDSKRRKVEEASVFFECYLLALTQEKKNKDIPEGGGKGVIFCQDFIEQGKEEDLLFSFQKKYVQELVSLVNYDEMKGGLKDSAIVDYYKIPEYLYLGPDERLKDYAVEWIAQYAAEVGYRPGHVFMTSKSGAGINHKAYGVTSQGVVAWIEEAMEKLFHKGCKTEPWSLIMTGGPDGDVASNTIKILEGRYPNTARFIGIKDKSGIAYDPQGLKMEELVSLAKTGQPISFYPYQALSSQGFLLRVNELTQGIERFTSSGLEKPDENFPQQEFNNFLFSIPCDLFVPAGGRPYTITEDNVSSCFQNNGKPSFPLIVEGANLFFSQAARDILEKKGVSIVKDSSANKGGVISSSYEVLSGLILNEEEFLFHKERIVKEIINRIRESAKLEASLLFSCENDLSLTKRSLLISEKIHSFAFIIHQALAQWDPRKLYLCKESDPFRMLLLHHALPLLREKYMDRLVMELPLQHQRACVAAYLSSMLVYTFGLSCEISIETVEASALLLIREKELST